MKSFLSELAEVIHQRHRQLDALTLVFPNRRAVLYFRKHLSKLLDRPAFAPNLITIEDFISDLSSLKVPDKLELIHRLYLTYNELIKSASSSAADDEPFEKFYFWGDMLLRDFDECDKYMVNADQLFKDLSNQKELDSSFDYLTDEQRDFLKSFWSSFEAELTENKKKFLDVWNKLYTLYTTFRERLLSNGLAYEGMLHRIVAEDIAELSKEKFENRKISFAGFNALTKTEETIISFFVAQGTADVFWDTDEYYVNNSTQEAGKFFREYQQHEILGKTFSTHVPSNFLWKSPDGLTKVQDGDTEKSVVKTVRVFGAAEPVGQAKVMAQVLQEQLMQGIDPEDTLIVLPDEKLLLPVLHGVSGLVERLNITMGFPISSTPLYNLVELLVEMQISRKLDCFNHRQVLALLGHPYVVAADTAVAAFKRKEVLSNNWVHIPVSFLGTAVPLHRTVFREVDSTGILSYLREVVTVIGGLSSIGDFDKEYAFHFLKLLNRMEEVIGDRFGGPTPSSTGEVRAHHDIKKEWKATQTSLKSFLRLFRQLIQVHKIPFSGEPLKGLQIMGVLETRNLDYKNVFILSLNEGAFPAVGSKGSYIPFNIRKAYGLPTVEHQDAMYAYLFYRMLQRAENVFLFFNSETDVLGQGEMSRYLQQLIYESGLNVEKRILHNPIQPKPVDPIVVRKDDKLIQALVDLNAGNNYYKGISPSALNTYIECRLKFYLHYVARAKEPKEVEEDLDARVLGNFVHKVMELFYKEICKKNGRKEIKADDLINPNARVDKLIDQVFIEEYRLDPSKPVIYEGQKIIVSEVVKRFVLRIIEMDKMYAPFSMEGLEQGGLLYHVTLDNFPVSVIVSGNIDRVDRKNNILRIIDYKTGKDQLNFDSVASLFERDGKRNKAAFQTMLYALLYKANAKTSGFKIVPGLINRLNLFDKNFQFGLKLGKDHYVDDVDVVLPEFEQHLKLLLEELYNPEVPFDQTKNVEICRYCAYQNICYR